MQTGLSFYPSILMLTITRVGIDTHMDGCCAVRRRIVKIRYSEHIHRDISDTLKHHRDYERSQVLASVFHHVIRTPLKQCNDQQTYSKYPYKITKFNNSEFFYSS